MGTPLLFCCTRRKEVARREHKQLIRLLDPDQRPMLNMTGKPEARGETYGYFARASLWPV